MVVIQRKVLQKNCDLVIVLSPLELASTFSTIVPGWIKELGIRETYGHQTKEQSNH